MLRLHPRVKRPLTFVPSRFIICLLEAPSGVQPSYAQGAEGAPGDGPQTCPHTNFEAPFSPVPYRAPLSNLHHFAPSPLA
jgi:hypothetical protein